MCEKKSTILIGNQYKQTLPKLLNYRNNLIGHDDHTISKLEDVSKEQEEDKQGCKELLEVSHLNIKSLKTFYSPYIFGGIFKTLES